MSIIAEVGVRFSTWRTALELAEVWSCTCRELCSMFSWTCVSCSADGEDQETRPRSWRHYRRTRRRGHSAVAILEHDMAFLSRQTE
uniref:Secreted protein n=1 Tax=Knipowitschia caucasica TaxID=637954 RepID=A0AAV2LXN3_KNICA